jgi:hypothetical protein
MILYYYMLPLLFCVVRLIVGFCIMLFLNVAQEFACVPLAANVAFA